MLKLKHLISLFVIPFLVLFSFISKAALPKCEDVFPSALSTFNNKAAYIYSNSQITNQNSNVLVSRWLYDYSGSSCNSSDCVKSGTNSAFLPEPQFINPKRTIEANGELSGDYLFESGSLDLTQSNLSIMGPTRIYVKNGSLTLRHEIKNNNDANDLILYVGGDVIPYSTSFSAFVYAKNGRVELSEYTQFKGAFSSGVMSILRNDSSIEYQTPTGENFDGICEVTVQPIVEYQFDSCDIDDIGDDALGNYDASANGISNVTGGMIGNSLDLTDSNTNDWLSVPKEVVDGLDDFTFSVWINTSEEEEQQEIFHALGKNKNDDELEIHLSVDDEVVVKIKDEKIELESDIKLTNGQWHQIVLTRKNDEICLYVDGSKEECDTPSSSGTLSVTNNSAIVIGQEQDSYGGSFSSSQSFVGLMDELRLSHGAMASSLILNAYQNESQGLEYDDGSSRKIESCDRDPVLDLRFDELNYSGTNTLLDSSDNNYNATAFNISPVDGLLCNAADLTNSSSSDLIEINPQAMDGLTDFTIIVWGKTSSTSNSTILSAAQDGSSLGANEATFMFDNNNNFWPTIAESPFDTSTKLNRTVNMRDNNWHQLVWTRKASINQSCFLYDGVNQGCVTHDNNNKLLEIAGLVLGQEQDSLLGGYDSSQDWEGLLDELLIFDAVLSKEQINDIKNNIGNSKNWDGTQRICPTLEPIAEYRFDESSWRNNTTDVKDSTSNNLDLTAHNAQTDYSNPIPSMPDGSNFCRYGEFNGQDNGSYLELSSNNFDITSELTVTSWININQFPNELKTIVSKDSNYEFHVTSNGGINWWWSNGAITSSNHIKENTWHHIAITYKSGSQVIYIDGVSRGVGTYSGALSLNNSPFQIGQDQNHPGRFFNGSIDEVRVYNQFLSQQNIIDIMTDSRTCAQQVDHYRLELDANNNAAFTCEAFPITVKACESSNSDGSCNLFAGNVAIDLSPNIGWLDNANIPIMNGAFNFTSGSTDIKFSQSSSGKVSYRLDSANPDAGLKCFIGNSEVTCETMFKDSGFIFTDISGNTLNIPDQISAVASDNIYLKSVEKNTVTGSCQTAFEGSETIDLKLNCNTPGVCSTDNAMRLTLGSNTIKDAYTAVSVNFDASNNHLAHLGGLNYRNAGEISLSAQATAPTGAVVAGESNSFVVIPAKFDVFAEDNPNAVDANSTVYKTAGKEFNVNINALNADGVITDNFNAADIDLLNKFSLSHDLQAPTLADGGVNGVLANEVVVNDFSAGQAVYKTSWNEVGIIKLKANLASGGYLSHLSSIAGEKANIGRFIPSHFKLISSDVFKEPKECNDFIYMGQSFTTNYVLEAQNILGGVTKNYTKDSGFDKGVIDIEIENDDISGSDYQPASYFGNRLTYPTSSWNLGTVSVASSNNSVLAKTTNQDGNFALSDLILSILDPDGVNFLSTDLNQNANETACGSPINCTGIKLNSSSLDFRYGRLALQDSYGSEFDEMQIPMRAEYWDGAKFILNSADSCTDYSNSLSQISPTTPNLNFLIKGSDTKLASGLYGSQEGLFVAPLKGEQQGNFLIEYTATPAWLLFDWDDNNLTPDENPKSNIQFGRFRSNDRVIYWREQ
ncbi:hypothetical protein KO527_09060 [Pseudoalteromonas sp. C2R02]|uniref:LamG domain-containing protein n=1 Tax=Pseudoalteromonas sp. C2R02 TaxID=2841565 RepID=UPI001C0920A8|nr:LamG domain-containing protein [Pseudoalteromonas sp. C2R02]MBU2969491.1 hypothetical protein [Pseudoalteromonas sp. C2R02]